MNRENKLDVFRSLVEINRQNFDKIPLFIDLLTQYGEKFVSLHP